MIEPSTGGYWLADNPDNANLIQETYILQVVAWAKATYDTSGTEKVYLIGFSRTGITLQGLFFHRPDLYQAIASWDFPAMMTGADGTDPTNGGAIGGGPAASYGTQDNFAANYELSPANLAKWSAGQNFGTTTRIWIGGYSAFQPDVTAYDPVLTAAGILHTYALVAADEHNWAPTPGWVAPALAAILPVAGPAAVTVPKPALHGTGTVTLTGTGSVRVPKPSLAGSGAEKTTGTGSVRVPKPSLAGTGTATVPVGALNGAALTGTATAGGPATTAVTPASAPAQVFLTVPQGDDVTIYMTILKADGVTPQPLSGLTPTMVIKAVPAAPDSAAVATLTAGNGLTVTGSTGGTLTAFLPHALLTGAWSWWWHLSLADGSGDRATVMYGPLTLFPV